MLARTRRVGGQDEKAAWQALLRRGRRGRGVGGGGGAAGGRPERGVEGDVARLDQRGQGHQGQREIWRAAGFPLSGRVVITVTAALAWPLVTHCRQFAAQLMAASPPCHTASVALQALR